MKKSKLDAPHVKKAVARRLAAGESQRSIAADLKLNASAVCRFVSREDIKALIEQEQSRLLDVVPDAVENVKRLVREMKDIPASDSKRMELAYRASTDVLRAVGMMANPQPSQFVANIIQPQTETGYSPVIQELLKRYALDLSTKKITGDTAQARPA